MTAPLPPGFPRPGDQSRRAPTLPDPNGRCLSCGAHTGEAVEFCADCQPDPEDDE